MKKIIIIVLIIFTVSCSNEVILDTTEICVIEYNPQFNATQECMNHIESNYADKDCTFELSEFWDIPLGACLNCSVECK